MDFCKTGVMKDYSVGKGSHNHPHGGDKVATDPPAKKNDPKANLLNRVPNQKAYDKLSQRDKDGFNAAAKKAGLPTKTISAQSNDKYRTNTDRVATDKMPTLPPKKMKVKESYVGQKGPSKPDEKMNRRYS